MDRKVTLDWLNCLSDRRVKLRKLSDPALVDYLFDLLIRFQSSPQNCVKYCTEDRKKMIIQFLKTKIPNYEGREMFENEETLLNACWIFLHHVVFSLEDSKLRNHLTFQLDNVSQEFIKSFFEYSHEQTLDENVVSSCLRRATEKCAHLEESKQEFNSGSSSNSTPSNQTPTGVKKRLSSTLREYLMSPNAQKKLAEEHTKELKRLKADLQTEILEKSEVMEENEHLQKKLEQLNRQLQSKINDNVSMRREIESMELRLNETPALANSSVVEKRQLADLEITLTELRSCVATLEKENDSITKKLSLKDKTLSSVTKEFNFLQEQFTELQLTLVNKDEIIERLNKAKEFFKTEVASLKEINHALTEKVSSLEVSRSSVSESKPLNLESELEFQMMKHTIELANKNVAVIEAEQARFVSENQSLNERIKTLIDERKDIDATLKELYNRTDTLTEENTSLRNAKENLYKKLKQTEANLLDEKEQLQKEITKLQESLNHYAFCYEDFQGRNECLLADNENLGCELQKAKDELLRNESQLKDMNLEMELVKSENIKLSKKLNDLESNNVILNASLMEALNEKSKLIKSREELEKRLAKNKETIESLVKQTSQEQDRSTELRKMTEMHMKKIEQSENSLKKLEEERIDLNKRISILHEELKVAGSRYKYEAEAHSKTEIKLSELEQIISKQNSTNEGLESDLKSKQMENKTLQCRIKELEVYIQEIDHNNEKLKISLDDLTKEKEGISIKCSEIEQKAHLDQDVIRSLTNQLSQAQIQRNDLESEIHSLTGQLEAERRMLQDLQNENTKIVDQLNKLSVELKNHHVLFDNEVKVNEDLQLQIKDLQRTVSEQSDHIENIEKQRDTMSSATHTLEEKLRRTERDLKHERDQLVKYKEDVDFLENEQKTLREEISALETSLKIADLRNEQLEESVQEITSQKVLLEDAQSQLQKESAILKDSLEKAENEKRTLSDNLVDLTHQHQNLSNERIGLVKSVKLYESQIPELNEEITSLRNEISRLDGSNESLKHQLDQLTSQLESVEAEKLAKTVQYDSMVQQLENLENTYSDTLKNKQNLEKCNAERQIVIETLQNDLQSASALNDQLNERLQSLENGTSHLRDQLDELIEKSKRLQAENQSLQDTKTQLESCNQQLNEANENLNRQKQLECDQYELKINALNEDVIEMRDKLKKINEINETHSSNLQSVEATLRETEIEKEALQKDYLALAEQKQRVESDYQNETNHVERLKNKVAELEKLFGDQSTEMKLLKTDYDLSKDENHRLNDQLKELENNICELQERLKASVRETETLDNEKKTLLEKILGCENSFEEINRQNEILSENLKNILSEKVIVENEKKNLERRICEYDATIQTLTNEVVQLQSRIDKLSDENKNYEEQLKSAQTALNSMTEDKREFEEKYEKVYEELINIQGRYQAAKENNTKLQFKVAHLEETTDAQKARLTEETGQVEELRSERDSLLSKLEQKDSKLTAITSRWKQELDTMREERSLDANKIDKLLKDCKTQQETVLAFKEELADLHKRYEELQESKSEALNELREMFLQQIDQLLSNNETLKSENEKLLDSNKEKAWYVKEMHKRIGPIIEALEEHEKKLRQLQKENESLTKEIDECNSNKWALKSQNERLAALVAQTEIEKERLNKEIQNLKDEKDLLRIKTDRLKLENEEIKSSNDRLRKLMCKGSNEHEELKKKNEKLAQNNEKLQIQISQLELDSEKELNTKVNLQNEVDNLRAKEVELKKSNETLLEERNAMLDQKIIFEQENAKIKRRLEELTQQKIQLYDMSELNSKAFENQIQSLISQKDDQLVTIQNLRGENEVLKSEIEAVKTTAATSTRKQVEKLEKELTKANLKQKEMYELYEKEATSLSEANHRLLVKLEKQKSLNTSLESKLSNYEELVSIKNSLTVRIDELKTNLEESLEQNERLTDEMNLISDRNAALVKENENLLSKVDELEIKMEAMEETVSAKDKEISMLQDEYRIFKDEYRKLSEHKNELDKDWKETLLDNFKSASAKCEKLTNEVAEKQSIIVALEEEMQTLKGNASNLNQTRVIASGPDNKTDTILKEENQRLVAENEMLRKKAGAMKAFVEKERETLKQKSEKIYSTLNSRFEVEYAGKLERAKNEYLKQVSQKFADKEAEWKKKEQEYQRIFLKEKNHIKELSSQLWDMNDKCLRLKQSVDSNQLPSYFRRCSVDNILSPGTLSRRTQSATNLNMMDGRFQKPLDFDRRLSTMSEDIQFHTRNKKPLASTSGKKFSLSSAKVFPTEDEDEMEIFDNACLADLKQGRMGDDSDFNKSRLSVLQARNSLCPPHLKSSYPAETQFIPLQELGERDIKMGLSALDDEHSDIENLLPGDRLKKNRNQTSYKKPGPPTPSKHGGRASAVGVETPRKVLKESNDNGTARRKSFTPARIFNFFPMRGHATVTSTAPQQQTQDENSSVTPKRNRLQSLRRRFSKNPQELGNTNSAYN